MGADVQQSTVDEQGAMTPIGDPIEKVIGAFDSWVIRLYSRGRFTILREIFLEEIGQYLPRTKSLPSSHAYAGSSGPGAR